MDTWFNYLFGACSILLSFELDYGLIRAVNAGLFDNPMGICYCVHSICAVVFIFFVGIDHILRGKI